MEVSSKSKETLGSQLSAFHLNITTEKTKQTFSVETTFQSSKVFEKGGPYRDLLLKAPKDAKRDPRLKNSGNLLHFNYFGKIFELHPKTLFYDWLYINALSKHRHCADQIVNYDAFTDIEFNPEKSINCQARSVALFVSLHRRQLLRRALFSLDEFKRLVYTEEQKENTQQMTFDF
jgi:type I restriction enzyme M protein